MTDSTQPGNTVQPDAWTSLKQFTAARIALGRTGSSIPMQESLHFKMAHAHARDAVYASLKPDLVDALAKTELEVMHVKSKASSRLEYLQRPDLGRVLCDGDAHTMKASHGFRNDIVFIVTDGLSATAINQHAVPFLELVLKKLQPLQLHIGPVVVVEQGRVAISDEIGFLLKASLVIILIGERPGLSSPDSLGVYMTYNPSPGLNDHARNCISNIRPEGLKLDEAAEKLVWLAQESLRRKISGVWLKEEGTTQKRMV